MSDLVKVTSILKQKTNYEVNLTTETLILDPSVVLKYRIKTGDELSPNQLRDIQFDQQYLEYEQMAIKKLKKMQTVFELKTFLESKGASKIIVKTLIDRYIKHKYLDDLTYAKTYVSFKKNTQGPKMLLEKLKEKGISQTIIDMVFKTYDEQAILHTLISKKIQKTQGKSVQQLKTQLYTHFMSKGFSSERIQDVISKNIMSYDVDEDALIKKTYELAFHKYSQTLNHYDASQKAFQKCVQKGFKYHVIKRVMEQLED